MEHSYKFFKELLIEKLKPEKIEGKTKLFKLKYEFSVQFFAWHDRVTSILAKQKNSKARNNISLDFIFRC